MADEVTFTMRLDQADFARMFGAGGAPGIAGGVRASGGEGTVVAPGPTFMQIFKPLLALELIRRGVDMAVANSRVAGAYLGAMGKVFGAAIDMLLTPFLPIFNVIMVAVMKLISWMITSGFFEMMTAALSRAAVYLEGIINWITKVWTAITSLNFAGFVGLMISGIGSAVSTALKDPLGVLALAITGLAAAYLASKYIPGMGGLMGGIGGGAAMAGRGIAGGAGMLGGLGAVLPALGVMGLGIAGTQLAGAGAERMGAPSGLVDAGKWAGTGASIGAGLGMLGGPLAPLTMTAGAGIGAGVGLAGYGVKRLGESQGWWGGDKEAGGGTVNSGNTINVNVAMTNKTPREAADQIAAELQRQTGYAVAARG